MSGEIAKRLILPLEPCISQIRPAFELVDLLSQGFQVPDDRLLGILVEAMVRERLQSSSKWLNGDKVRTTETLSCITDWYQPGDAFSDWWECNLFDNIHVSLLQIIDDKVGYIGWDLWTVEHVGDSLILTNRGDYRILDWQRRVEKGEWSIEDGRSELLDSIRPTRRHSARDSKRKNTTAKPIGRSRGKANSKRHLR